MAGEVTLSEAKERLKAISECEGYKNRTIILWVGISCAFFSVMFKGNLLDFFITFLVGLGVGYLQNRLTRKHIVTFFVLFICSLFIGFSVMFCYFLFKDAIKIEPIIIGCIMPLLPGVAFTTAVRDAIGDELISGIARAVEALLVAVALAAGIGVSLSTSFWLGGLL